jgi:predicted DNA-binding transcriptional regulator AlpA
MLNLVVRREKSRLLKVKQLFAVLSLREKYFYLFVERNAVRDV